MTAVPETDPAPADLRGPIVASVVGKAAEAVTLVLLATVVPRVLGPTRYGEFAVALTVVAIGTVALTLGGATLMARYLPSVPVAERAALARALTLRLSRNRAALLVGTAVVAAVLVVVDPDRFPAGATGLVLVALVLNVAATLLLQADLGLGRATAWCARYPLQNAVLIAAVLVLHEMSGSTTAAVGAIPLAGAVALGLGLSAAGPVFRGPRPAVDLPDGALRFSLVQATTGALTQVAQRGGILVVAVVAGSGDESGFAALAIGLACAVTYAIVQLFTVSLPRLVGTAGAEAALRTLAGRLLVLAVPATVVTVLLLDPAVPAIFGDDYQAATDAFGPAVAMVLLAPVNALALQVAAIRLQPEATLRAAVAGALVFGLVAAVAVPAWDAAGASLAALAGAVASALVAIRLLPGAVRPGLAVASLGGAALVTVLGGLT